MIPRRCSSEVQSQIPASPSLITSYIVHMALLSTAWRGLRPSTSSSRPTQLLLSLFRSAGKLLAGSELLGEADDCSAALFCEALFITRRCRKLDSDEVLGCRRHAPQRGENEAFFPKKGR